MGVSALNIPRLVLAGTHSGAGKTTLTTGLLAAFRRRGLRVQSFKAGPDYIDPACHGWATGRPGRNLDSWLMPRRAILELLERGSLQADIAIVEGVMGLYDGAGGSGEVGSTALLAKWLSAPVVLVVDAQASARSVAAIGLGFRTFDPGVDLAGVIANRVGGALHADMIRAALAGIGLPLLGAVGQDKGLVLPESHLGLVLPQNQGTAREWTARAAAKVEQSLDLATLLEVAQRAPTLNIPTPVCFAPETRGEYAGLRVGVARDAALWFYYPDSLELFTHLGVEVVPFSLMDDPALPPGLDGLYLGGGFPERFGAELAANASMRANIARAWRSGLPVHAECGGYMYLHERLIAADGREYEMAGCLPGAVRLLDRLQGIGYRSALPPGTSPPDPRALQSEPDFPAPQEAFGVPGQATPVRGHVFHYSRSEGNWQYPAWGLYRADGSFDRADGWAGPGQTASYLHVHLATQPGVAGGFLSACRAFRHVRQTAG